MLAENFRLLRTARHDALTDKLTEPAEPARARPTTSTRRARARAHTLVFFDLDGFKDYNDAFGHPGGRRAAAPARARAGAASAAYRLGGDEFCLLLPAR